MNIYFEKISTLKDVARKETAEYLATLNRSSKIFNKFLGMPPVTREWFYAAQKYFTLSKNFTGWKHVNHLKNALIEILKCDIQMKQSPFNDPSVTRLKNKIQTSYLNYTINFIEEYIHAESNRLKFEKSLRMAIAVLSETNVALANNYRKMMFSSLTLNDKINALQELTEIPDEKFGLTEVMKIKGILVNYQNELKKNNQLYINIKNLINIKFTSLYNYFNHLISIEKKKKFPSLKVIVQLIDSFEKLFTPLQLYINSSDFKTIFTIKEVYGDFLNFLNNDYPVLQRTYNKILINPNSVDYSTVSRLLKSIKVFDEFKNINFIEWINLSPSLKQIEDKFNLFLTKKFDNESLKYYEYYNDIINAEPSELKIKELINFQIYLQDQLQIHHDKEQLRTNITSLLSNSKNDLYELIEDIFNDKISEAKNRDEFSSGFDFAISYFMKLKDIEMINFLQKNKKAYLKELPEEKVRIVFPNKKNKISEDFSQDLNLPQSDSNQKKKSLNTNPNNLDTEYSQLYILDNYTTHNYIIFSKPVITLGRDSQNDIIIKCNWVSGKHLLFNFNSFTINDLNSTNGTYVNNQKFSTYNISTDLTFSIAKTFIFKTVNYKNFVLIKFVELIDQTLLKDDLIKKVVKTLSNTDFIYLKNDNFCSINLLNGKINSQIEKNSLVIKYSHPNFMMIDALSKLPEKIFKQFEIFNSGRFSFEIR